MRAAKATISFKRKLENTGFLSTCRELVADAPNGLDLHGGAFQLLAQPAYVHVYSSAVAVVLVSPDVVQQGLAGQDSLRVLGKVHEEVELLGPQLHLSLAHCNLPPLQVNAE